VGLDALAEIAALPADWPLAGSVRPDVLARLATHLTALGPIARSAETGTGRTTLLLSHHSRRHVVFSADDAGRGDSLASVRASRLLCGERTEFVIGPTQRTLPVWRPDGPLQVVLLDGPHGFPFPQLEYYFLYPHLAAGGLLVLDDIQIRAVNDLFRFLRTDPMFALVEVVHTTAFFRRTDAPTFDPLGDGWWRQPYNVRVLPPLAGLSPLRALRSLVPLAWRDRLSTLRRGSPPVRLGQDR
jgi:hypothetical protein